MGNEAPQAAPVGEIINEAEFYDFDSKYVNGTSKPQIPANLPTEVLTAMAELGKAAYSSLGCTGFARADIFMDKDTGGIYLNEINTLPGNTDISMFRMMWKEAGMTYTELSDRIIELAFE